MADFMDRHGATILIVEDDADIRRLVRDLLRGEGFSFEEADGAAAMDAVLSRVRPDLIVLDLMLPGEDGLSICRRLRLRDTIPILMLTAKSDEIDRVVGLELGADDYLVKPFGPRELLARIRAVLRRVNDRTHGSPAARRFAFDRFVIDLDARQIADEAGAPIEHAAIPHPALGADAVVTASFGAACSQPGHVLNIAEIIASADAALYAAKRNGRNQVWPRPLSANSAEIIPMADRTSQKG